MTTLFGYDINHLPYLFYMVMMLGIATSAATGAVVLLRQISRQDTKDLEDLKQGRWYNHRQK